MSTSNCFYSPQVSEKKAFDRVSFLLDKGIFDDMAPIISDYVLKDKEVSGI